eukprot:GHVT01064183.1.p1 GENE.GHVT01064183.1~~GHVT01064183.1.p1  ORF type:complete len:235 (-),score=37.95 GHVT01064183.1:677-1381(-)
MVPPWMGGCPSQPGGYFSTVGAFHQQHMLHQLRQASHMAVAKAAAAKPRPRSLPAGVRSADTRARKLPETVPCSPVAAHCAGAKNDRPTRRAPARRRRSSSGGRSHTSCSSSDQLRSDASDVGGDVMRYAQPVGQSPIGSWPTSEVTSITMAAVAKQLHLQASQATRSSFPMHAQPHPSALSAFGGSSLEARAAMQSNHQLKRDKTSQGIAARERLNLQNAAGQKRRSVREAAA